MSEKKAVQICVRISQETDQKLKKIMAETNKSRSEVVNIFLNNDSTVLFFDCRKIAEELFRIRTQLEKFPNEFCAEKIISALNLLKKEIKRVFLSGGEPDGDSQGN